MSESAWTCRYLSISSDFQRPTIWVMSRSMRAPGAETAAGDFVRFDTELGEKGGRAQAQGLGDMDAVDFFTFPTNGDIPKGVDGSVS